MYEIWLTLNILFELGLQYLPTVIGTVLLWLMLMIFASPLRVASMSLTLSGVTSRRKAGTFSASRRPLRS